MLEAKSAQPVRRLSSGTEASIEGAASAARIAGQIADPLPQSICCTLENCGLISKLHELTFFKKIFKC